jgi:hypothetical protein
MPSFKLEYQGKSYRVDGPDAQTAAMAFKRAMKIGAPEGPPPPQNDGRGTREQREGINERDLDIANRAVGQMEINDRTAGAGSNMLLGGVPFSDEMAALARSPSGLFNGRGMGEEYQRQMEAERLIQDAYSARNPVLAPTLRTVGGAASIGPGGAANAGLGRTVIEAAGLGAAGGAAEGQGIDRVNNAAIGGAIGAVGGTIGGALAGGNGQKAIGAGQEAVEAAARQGVPLPKIAATDSRTVKMAGQGIAGTFAGSPISKSLQGANQALGTKLDDLAQRTAPGGNKAVVGGSAKGAVEDYITNISKKKVSKAYDKVDAKIVDPNATVSLGNTGQAAAGINAKNAASRIKGTDPSVDFVSDALAAPGMTYPEIKGLRSAFGEQLEGGPLASIKGKDANRMYGALSEDLRESVQAGGGQAALGAFNRANRYAALIAERNQSLSKLLGKTDEAFFDTVTGAAMAGGRENARLLNQVRAAIPRNEWDNVTASVISKLGRNNVGEFSPSRFLADLHKVSDAGKATLFGKELRETLDDLALVAGRLKETESLANHSKTGNVASLLAAGSGAMVDPVTTISLALGGNMMARLLAKPASVRQVTAWSKAYQQFAKTGTRTAALVLQNQTRTLGASVAREMGNANLTPQIVQALLGTHVAGKSP